MNSNSNSLSLMMSKHHQEKNKIKIMVPQSLSAPTASSCDQAPFFIQNYSNFKRSSEPAKFMYYESGSWQNYPKDVVERMKLGFVEGKPVIEAQFCGYKCLFDFYRMLELEFESGNQRSISWIDVDGKCFFPKVFINSSQNSENTIVNCDENNHKIEIEIRISDNFGNLENSNGPDLNKLENLSKRKRENLENVARVKTDESSSDFNNAKRRQTVGDEVQSARWPKARVLRGQEKGYLIVKNLFLSGLGMLEQGDKITSIHQCLRSGPLDKARHEMFLNLVEITKLARGDSNTVFAWFGTSAKCVESILTHGFGMPGKVPGPEGHGIGIYLSPIRSPHYSAMMSDMDENGEKHVILCRVILGKCEKLEAGSRQSYPSSVEYDSGVDDLKNPKWYVVWCANMNTHILPECVVSYKPVNVSDRAYGISNVNYVPHGSNSLIMKLFSKLRSSLPLPKIQALQTLCGSYKEGKLGKELFVTELQSVVGDDILRSTISDIHG